MINYGDLVVLKYKRDPDELIAVIESLNNEIIQLQKTNANLSSLGFSVNPTIDTLRLNWLESLYRKYPKLAEDGMVPMTRAQIDAGMKEEFESATKD